MISHMEFECKLAHQPLNVKTVGGFNSIKELYDRISHTFSVPSNEILFCTLNSRNPRDMDNLLANYLSVGDSINAHLLGDSELLNLVKSQEHLGLTITDNGHGRAFVKRMKCDDIKMQTLIKPGDHIAAINSRSVVGMRHFEVAKALRQIPLNSEFQLEIFKPLIACYGELNDDNIDADSTNQTLNDKQHLKLDNKQPQSLFVLPKRNCDIMLDDNKTNNHDYLSLEDLADTSLPLDRILSRTTIANDTTSATSSVRVKNNDIQSSPVAAQNAYKIVIKNINSILESGIGIDDHTLAIRIYRLARDNERSLGDFSKAIQSSELSVFNFGPEIESHLWNCVNKAL